MVALNEAVEVHFIADLHRFVEEQDPHHSVLDLQHWYFQDF
jgi:hypothetical protein